jgi:hypothetical protein
MIGGPPFFQRRNTTKANESVNRTNQIVFSHAVHGRGKCALAPVNPIHKALTPVAPARRFKKES